MKFINSLKKFTALRFAVGLMIVGLIVAIISGITLFAPSNDSGEYATTTATFSSIEVQGDGEDAEYFVYVTYTVDGKEYNTQLNSYDSRWKVGDTTEIEYDVNDPASLHQSGSKTMSIAICIIGIGAFVLGVLKLKKSVKTPKEDYTQYDKVKEIDIAKAEEIKNANEENEEYVFHFTGHLNQDYVMKNKFGEPVYEAVCNGIKLVKDTEFEFRNIVTGETSTKKIGHTTTQTYGNGSFNIPLKSSFKIDGNNCWDVLAQMGYGFEFSLNGIKAHYEVNHHGVNIGYAELGGTCLVDKKHENNPLAKAPTNGIFKVSCPKSEIEGMFLICFCITKTDLTIN